MEPISMAMAAFAGVQKAVALIKEAQKTANDVGSLGPMLGQYFDSKSQTVTALAEAKNAGGSSMAQAVQIEMQLLQQRKFEEEMKMIFFQTGNADVWESITARVADSEKQMREASRRARDAAIQRKKKMKQMLEMGIAIALVVLIVPPLMWLFVQGLFFGKSHGWFK